MSLSHHNLQLDGTTFQYWLFIAQDGTRYCKLKDIAKLLGYVDPKKAYHLVDEEWKITWQQLTGGSFPTPGVVWHPNTLFVSEPGIYALLTRSHKPRAKRIRHELFETFVKVERTLAEVERMVEERNRTIAEMDDKLREEIQEKCRLMNIVAVMRPKVAVVPEKHSVRHSLYVYRRADDDRAYTFIRTQKRNLEKACNQIPENSQLVFSRENVPNSINVVNRLKEKLPSDARWNYRTVVTDAPVVDLLRECMEDEIERPVY